METEKATMGRVAGRNILAVAACLMMIMPPSVFAGDQSPFEYRSPENSIPTVPALGANGSSTANTAFLQNVVPPPNPLVGTEMNPSPLSLPDNNGTSETSSILIADTSIMNGNFATSSDRSSVDTVSAVTQIRVFSGGLYTRGFLTYDEAQFAQDTLSTAYEDGSLSFQVHYDPKYLDRIKWVYNPPPAEDPGTSGTLADAGQGPAKDTFIRAVVDLANNEPDQNEGGSTSPDPESPPHSSGPVQAVVRALRGLMYPTRFISSGSVSTAFINDATTWATLDLLNKANEGVDQMREHFEDRDLARSLAMAAALNKWINAGGVPMDALVQGRDDAYQVLDSINIDGQLAAVHYLVNLSKQLHPFFRWYLHKKYVSENRAKRYEAARQKILRIYQSAKAGQGLIRYKGRVCPAYLPFPDEMGGTYELVIPRLTNLK